MESGLGRGEAGRGFGVATGRLGSVLLLREAESETESRRAEVGQFGDSGSQTAG